MFVWEAGPSLERRMVRFMSHRAHSTTWNVVRTSSVRRRPATTATRLTQAGVVPLALRSTPFCPGPRMSPMLTRPPSVDTSGANRVAMLQEFKSRVAA